jgi:hypothetical protein
MRTRLLVLPTAALALLLCAPVGADAATTKVGKCKLAKKWHVVAKNRTAVVFTVDRPNSEDTPQTLFGCVRSKGVRLKLGDAFDNGIDTTLEFGQVLLNGRFVAWQWTAVDNSCRAACPPDYVSTTYQIERADLKTRRSLMWDGGFAEGNSLRLSDGGNTAWVQPAATGHDVHTGTLDGNIVIDSGTIDPASLELTGTLLSWTNAGTAKSAQLP